MKGLGETNLANLFLSLIHALSGHDILIRKKIPSPDSPAKFQSHLIVIWLANRLTNYRIWVPKSLLKKVIFTPKTRKHRPMKTIFVPQTLFTQRTFGLTTMPRET